MELFFVQKESTDNVAPKQPKNKKKKHEIFHTGKIRAVDTVRLRTPGAAWGVCGS